MDTYFHILLMIVAGAGTLFAVALALALIFMLLDDQGF